MCFDHDGYPEFAETSVVKCRKPHRCEECGRAIPAGELASYSTGKFDGAFYAFHSCGECEATRSKVADRELEEGCRGSEIWCPIGMLRDYCDEADFPRESFESGQSYLDTLREKRATRRKATSAVR